MQEEITKKCIFAGYENILVDFVKITYVFFFVYLLTIS